MKDLNGKCFICGIYESNGIMLNGKHICLKCENNIVKNDVDEEIYTDYVKKIKSILFN